MGALWGIVTPILRKFSVELVGNTITLHFYYEKEPTEQEIELSEDAATEVIADFSEPYLIDCQRHIINMPQKVDHQGLLVYFRFEE